ncbi:VapE domain-containing protein [Prevotella sp. P2-180]|uniref:VapE domain-containing protein n=1 Tax=Prevotella sp. P2-180 TaxID=2024224 RepID=UPI000B97A5F3|nr:VapE domain-containing protein [Prevotella sp. P2-180]OYP67430.1 hypothetical protein CIK98_05125 [Prevotella sp. P2-180]
MTNEVTFFSSLTDKEPKLVSWEHVATMIRSTQLQKQCDDYRSLLSIYQQATDKGDKQQVRQLKSQLAHIKHQLPAFMPQAMVEGGKAAENITRLMPFMIVDLDHIPDDLMATTEKVVKNCEYARLAYRTVSGHGLHVIVKMDGEVTQDNFKDAWLTANEMIKKLTGVDYDNQCGNINRLSALACDPTAVYRPVSKAVKIKSHKRKAQKTGKRPACEKAGTTARKLVDNEGFAYEEGGRNNYVSRVIYWMNRFGVNADKTLKWAEKEFKDYDIANGHPIAGIVKAVYDKHTDEHNTCRPAAFAADGNSRPRKSTIMEVEAYLTARYTFRRNILSQDVENCHLISQSQPSSFNIMTDAAENSLWIELQRAGLNTDMQTLHAYLTSNCIEQYHPVKSYLDSLPEWDGHDHIADLLGMVHCRDCTPEKFDFYVRRWLVAMVAATIDDEVVNHQIFVLLGPQGTYKTSFMNNLLPPELRRYFCVKTNSQRMTKDDAFALTENILIDMEEIDSMGRQEVNQLKAMASQPFVKDRPFYGRSKVRLPHRASFCATGNNLQFLTDDTGNRRWLVFEVDHIDNPWKANINYVGVYSQIRHLLDSGFRYWFDSEEIAKLNTRNRAYETPNLARELISTRYRKPGENEKAVYLTASDIVARFGGQVRLSPVQVGKALQDMGIEQYRSRDGRFWKLYERPASDIGNVLPDGEEPPQKDMPF